MKHPPIGAEPVPPDPGGRQAAAADDTHQANLGMGEQFEQVCQQVLIHHQGILMEIDLILGLALPLPRIVPRAHGRRSPLGQELSGEALWQVEMLQVKQALAVPVLAVDTSDEGDLPLVQFPASYLSHASISSISPKASVLSKGSSSNVSVPRRRLA